MRFPVSGRGRWLALVVVVLGLVGGGLYGPELGEPNATYR